MKVLNYTGLQNLWTNIKNFITAHTSDTIIHVTANDKSRWDSKANASHTHASSDITDIGDFATKSYVDTSISGLVDSAPNTLDTLKELSTALGDDANFASTVATALGSKANSADLATVATSGSYNDLSDKPTIPTVNNATLTIQKNGTTVKTFTANASSNVTANITVPTKTSDLTNDSNYVDTSNSAVASGITSAKVTSYDGHIADTNIHVTFADKTSWNGKADDSAVVHNSGNETIDGQKTFSGIAVLNSYLYFTNSSVTKGTIPQTSVNPYRIYFGSGTNYGASLFNIDTSVSNTGVQSLILRSAENVVSGDDARMALVYDPNRTQPRYLGLKGNIEPNANNTYECGTSTYKWKSVYATNYYYGADNTEFSDKFVTTDTAQDIEGDKNFKGLLTTIPDGTIWPVTASTTDDITYLGANAIHVEQKSSGKLSDLSGGAWSVAELGLGCFFFRINNGADIRYKNFAQNTVNRIPVVSGANRFMNDVLPEQDNTYSLGSSSLRWKTINNVNPGALSLPDLSNGLDISSYITDLTGASNINKYTPTVNGWISIGLSGADFIELYIPNSLMGGSFTKSINNYSCAFMPVVANKEVRIALKGTAIGWAKLFPCLGNV